MTENFIIDAFHKMGEEPQTVRLMRNKYTGEPAGYCFVNFQSDEQSIDAMHKLNGKPIPGTNPIVRFRLNSASNSNKLPGNEREFSVWVGDLSSDVDDYNLYRVFSNKYSSIKTAKVILDSSGFSKGYGFVRFGLEEEQKSALYEMNGYIGLGTKPLKICNAVPKPKSALPGGTGNNVFFLSFSYFTKSFQSCFFLFYFLESTTSSSAPTFSSAASTTTDLSQYYDPSSYWQASANTYGAYDQTATAQTDYTAYYQQQAVAHVQQQNAIAQQHNGAVLPTVHHVYNPEEDDLALVGKCLSSFSFVFLKNNLYFYAIIAEHKVTLDAEQLNKELLERDRNLWDALESSKWLPVEQLEIF